LQVPPHPPPPPSPSYFIFYFPFLLAILAPPARRSPTVLSSLFSASQPPTSLSGSMPDTVTSSSGSNKRQRLDARSDVAPVGDNSFIQDNDAADSGADDDEDEERPKDKKAGRRKIKIEYILDKSRRHITFSKRKAGIMKKAYELSTLTGTQVLLLVVSETGLVYTFTTAKLQPLVTQPEGKNLIQACLNAPHGQLPSQMPVGTPIGRSSGPIPPSHPNVSGGLSINSKDDEGEREEPERTTTGSKRRRRGSTANQANAAAAANSSSPAASNANARSAPPPQSPHSPSAQMPPASVNIPPARGSGPQMTMGGSPPQAHAHPHQHQQPSNNYSHGPFPGGTTPDGNVLYAQPMMGPPPGYGYPGSQPQGGAPQAMPGAPQPSWGPPVQQSGHYGRR
jgi:pheromone receptor transcription factor